MFTVGFIPWQDGQPHPMKQQETVVVYKRFLDQRGLVYEEREGLRPEAELDWAVCRNPPKGG